MNPDLMRAAGLELRFDERQWRIVLGPRLLAAEGRRGRTAGILDADSPLPFGRRELVQRHVNCLLSVPPGPANEREIALVYFAAAQLRVQRRQRRPFLRHQQHARCIAVEAVHELEELRVGARSAELLDEAERNSAAAVHGQPGGLVDGDQGVVLMPARCWMAPEMPTAT